MRVRRQISNGHFDATVLPAPIHKARQAASLALGIDFEVGLDGKELCQQVGQGFQV